MKEDKKWEFMVAGVKFHGIGSVMELVHRGDILRMVSEPTNKYDPTAVRLHYLIDNEEETKEVMIGYVPAKISPQVSAFLLTADLPTCEIINFKPEGKPWEMIRCRIYDHEFEGEEEQDA